MAVAVTVAVAVGVGGLRTVKVASDVSVTDPTPFSYPMMWMRNSVLTVLPTYTVQS